MCYFFNSFRDCFSLRQGFTLVELLVVVSVVGFLSTLIIMTTQDTRAKSFDTRRLADINDFQKALELYSADNPSYPSGTSIELGGANAGCLSANGFTAICPAGGQRIYLSVVPANPGPTGAPYIYTRSGDGESYTITFTTETDIAGVSAGNHTLTPQGIQ